MRNARFHHRNQCMGNSLTTQMHAYGMCLHNCRLPVNVNYQSWQVVALTMYQTVGIVLHVVSNTNGLAHLECRAQAGTPKFVVDSNIRERKYSDGDGTFLIVSDSDKIA